MIIRVMHEDVRLSCRKTYLFSEVDSEVVKLHVNVR